MRAFILISIFIVTALARPDVSHLKNRRRTRQELPQKSLQSQTSNGYQYPQFVNDLQGDGPVPTSGYTNSRQQVYNQNGQASSTHPNSLPPDHYTQQGDDEEPLITKQFYIHAAPEDTSNTNKVRHFRLGRPQKNYRVIFIKAPSSSANAKITAEYAPQQEKTVVYVLSQKEHEIDIKEIATPAPTQPSKPEVFFIKYKTPEEAAHAQQQIQAQYDALGGVSQVSDEGLIPVSSVEGALDDEDFENLQGAGSGFTSTAKRPQNRTK